MKERKSIIMFLIIVIFLSSIVDFIWIRGGEAATVKGISALLMWCPGVAALIVRRIYYKKQSLLGFNKCKPNYMIAAVLIPLAYIALSYGLYWLINSDSFLGRLNIPTQVAANYTDKVRTDSAAAALITWVVTVISSIIAAAGEEIGWRGFLLPQMTKIWSFKKAVIVSGLIWAVWHMPIMISGLYNSGTPIWHQLPMFTIDILAFTIIISMLRMESKSIWPAIFIHAFHNNFDQIIFGPMTIGSAKVYYVGEIGIITISAIIFSAALTVKYFRRKSREQMQTESQLIT
jgi:uncharacterized protein